MDSTVIHCRFQVSLLAAALASFAPLGMMAKVSDTMSGYARGASGSPVPGVDVINAQLTYPAVCHGPAQS